MMCTLIVAKNVYSGFPLVVAANRDERLDRPSEIPKFRDNQTIYSPKDLQRGGSWVGVNVHGLFAGLTNRIDVASERGRMSRGDIVMQALRHRSALEAFLSFEVLRGDTLNGFNLVIADRKSMFLLRGDGKTIERNAEGDGLLVVTNHGVGRMIKDSTPARVTNVLINWRKYGLAAIRPTVEGLRSPLEIHDQDRYGTCINEPDHNYGTKSSCIIRLQETDTGFDWRYAHRERKSPRLHICVEGFEHNIRFSTRS